MSIFNPRRPHTPHAPHAPHAPTREQMEIITMVNRSLMIGGTDLVINAKAGTGKSSTLLLIADVAIALGKTVAVMVYNARAADELKERVEGKGWGWSTCKVGTVHSFARTAIWNRWRGRGVKPPEEVGGAQDWRETLWTMVKDKGWAEPERKGRLGPIEKFVLELAKMAAGEGEGANLMDVAEHYSLADQYLPPVEEAGEAFADEAEMRAAGERLAGDLLMAREREVEEGRSVTFEDMLYFAASERGRIWLPKYDVVLLDEAQDSSPARRLVAYNSLRPGLKSLFVAVGDPCQEIYGFAGASNNTLRKIVEERRGVGREVKMMPLSVTFRCPKVVVEGVRKYMPVGERYEAAEGNAQGEVMRVRWEEIFVPVGRRDVTPRPGDAILCRFNAPLVKVALRLLRHGKKVRLVKAGFLMEAIRVVEELRRGGRVGGDVGLDRARAKLAWLDVIGEEVRKLEEEGKIVRADMLIQHAQVVEALMEGCGEGMVGAGLGDWLTAACGVGRQVAGIGTDAMGSKDAILLLSKHSAKGGEWDRVYILGAGGAGGAGATHPLRLSPRILPSGKVVLPKPWMEAQELNLAYVAETRAKKELVLVEEERKPAGGGGRRGAETSLRGAETGGW